MRDTSVVWGEVQASAVFEPELREQLREATEAWSDLVAAAIAEGIARRLDPRRTSTRTRAPSG